MSFNSRPLFEGFFNKESLKAQWERQLNEDTEESIVTRLNCIGDSVASVLSDVAKNQGRLVSVEASELNNGAFSLRVDAKLYSGYDVSLTYTFKEVGENLYKVISVGKGRFTSSNTAIFKNGATYSTEKILKYFDDSLRKKIISANNIALRDLKATESSEEAKYSLFKENPYADEMSEYELKAFKKYLSQAKESWKEDPSEDNRDDIRYNAEEYFTDYDIDPERAELMARVLSFYYLDEEID